MGRNTKRAYAERVQVYLTASSEQDKVILDVWNECARTERPQEVFRAILRAGIKTMVENGDMPQLVVERCNLSLRLGIRHTPAMMPVMPGYYPIPMPGQMPLQPMQPTPMPAVAAPAPAIIEAAAPRTDPAPPRRPEREDAVTAVDNDEGTDAILGLMGRRKRD